MSNKAHATHDVILRVEDVTKKFPAPGGQELTACSHVSFNVRAGETVAIVGESGCGKTTLLKTLMNIHPPTEGRVLFYGEDVTKLTGEERRANYRHIQMVFQDPTAAFDPKMRIRDIICEPLENFGEVRADEKEEKARALLRQVELPEDFTDRYPHNMSGGQRQRVAIARALALSPEVIACDEATSALDVSVQDRIIQLLVRLQKEKGIAYVFICHDLALVSLFAHRVVIMYLGHVMERIAGRELQQARHPYTQALLRSVFSTDMEKNQRISVLPGEIPSPLDIPVGCPFQTRCPVAKDICRREKPELREIAPGHFVACHEPQAPLA